MACDGSVWLQNYYLALSADNAIGSLQEINTLRDLQKPNAILGSKSVETACMAYDKKIHSHFCETNEDPKWKYLLSHIE